MNKLIILLILLTGYTQYKLWNGPGGIVELEQMKKALIQQKAMNQKITETNALLAAEVNDLKEGYDAIEERARNELGMIKNNEKFYQLAK